MKTKNTYNIYLQTTSQSSHSYPPHLPPPPPPPPPGTTYTPIHYSFPSRVKQSTIQSNPNLSTNNNENNTNNNDNNNTNNNNKYHGQQRLQDNTNDNNYDNNKDNNYDNNEIPLTFNQNQYPTLTPNTLTNASEQTDTTKAASPRRDAITNYMATTRGALAIRTSSTMVGYTLGIMIGKV